MLPKLDIMLSASIAGPTANQPLKNFVRQGLMAERLGFCRAWLMEHRMTKWPAPQQAMILAAFLLAKTETLRIGTAVTPILVHGARRIIESATELNSISGGRFELGLGNGYDPNVFRAFGIRQEDIASGSDDALKQILQAPETNTNFPPIWLATNSIARTIYFHKAGLRNFMHHSEVNLTSEARLENAECSYLITKFIYFTESKIRASEMAVSCAEWYCDYLNNDNSTRGYKSSPKNIIEEMFIFGGRELILKRLLALKELGYTNVALIFALSPMTWMDVKESMEGFSNSFLI